MRIGIDGASWVSRRGYGRFLRNAGSRLVALDADSTYVVYIDEDSAVRAQLPARAEPRLVALGRPAHDAARADDRRRVADVLRMSVAVTRDRPDVFLFPSLHTFFPVLRVPTVVGIHDTIPEELPELTYPSRRARAYATVKRDLALRRATRIFTVSQASRAALARRFGLDPAALAVVPEAADPVFHPRQAAEIGAAVAPLGVRPGAFLVCAGGISPHKNLERLVAAYALLVREGTDPPPLVLVGDLDADPFLSSAASLRRAVHERALDGRVLLPGYVDDGTLACLYAGAAAVVIPSLAEGFGLPAVEAAACGAAVVLSDLPAHRETLDGAAVFVPPADEAAIAQAIGSLLADPARRAELGDRARSAVSRLSWDAAALALKDVLDEAAARG